MHETQDFAYRAPLLIDRAYTLDVACSQEPGDPARLAITAETFDGGLSVCTARTIILRIARTGSP